MEKRKIPVTIICKSDLIKHYERSRKTISDFYKLDINAATKMSAEQLCKAAIGGNTYRAFHRTNKNSVGMSSLFYEAVGPFINEDPTIDANRKKFIAKLIKTTNNKFQNLPVTKKGSPKLQKLYNLYANYWVAFNKANTRQQNERISKLQLPLDKYSLTFIRNIYNKQLTTSEIKKGYMLGKNVSMGSVIDMSHYNNINAFISKLCNEISKSSKKPFYPIYIDFLQAESNCLKWYKNVIKKYSKK